MAAPPPPPRHDSPPALPDEMVEEILLRLPPNDPACLLRASLVCKTWSRAVSSPGFRRRLHELHRTPPVLGFLHNWDHNEKMPHFIPTTASSFSLAAPDCRSWRALDCLHGRALFLSKGQRTDQLLVWEPVTGVQRHIQVPPSGDCRWFPSAAVFCAADGCDHRDCHGGVFRLVFVFSDKDYVTSACIYSSETGVWGELTSMHGHFDIDFTFSSGVLLGKSLFYCLSNSGFIVEYDLPKHGLTVFSPQEYTYYDDRFCLMLAEDGGLGLCQGLDPHLKLWSRKASDGTNARWVLTRVIYLENLLTDDALVNATSALHVLGFAEAANVIFVITVVGIFTIELQSERVRKVCDKYGFSNFIPVVSFYTPVPRGKHEGPLMPGPSEQPGGEDRGEEDKTLDQVQQLFDKGSIAINEGGLINSFECVSHDVEIRDPCYGEVALQCASMFDKHGHVLPSEAQQVTDPLGDVPNSALNEKFVKSTSITSKHMLRTKKPLAAMMKMLLQLRRKVILKSILYIIVPFLGPVAVPGLKYSRVVICLIF